MYIKKIRNLIGVYYFTKFKFFLRSFISYKIGDNYFSYLNKKFQTDKCIHNYDDFYVNFFRRKRFKKLKILEIGIGGHQEENFLGGSLILWNNYCPFSQIYGIDISSKPLFNKYRRIQTFVVDQSNTESLEEFAKEHGPFDIIIDDGSHFTDHILITFNAFYKSLNSDGCYFIEDMGTTYLKSFSGEPDIDKNSVFFTRIMQIAKMTSRTSISNNYEDLKEEFSKLHSVTLGDHMIMIKNSKETDFSYEHRVDPWLDRDELRKKGEWIKSNDGYGEDTEKLDSGQMGQ